MLLIAFVLLGIVAIMFVWLYETYKNKEDVLVAEVERSLFSSIQTYYRSQKDTVYRWPSEGQTNQGKKEFMNRIISEYPDIDRSTLQTIWDSSFNRSRSWSLARRLKTLPKPDEEQRTAVPFFMQQDLTFDSDDIQTLNNILDTILQIKNINITIHEEILAVDKRTRRADRKRYESIPGGHIKTRPILIDPERNQFITVVIEQPFLFILGKISLQVLTSVLLLVALIGAFLYLFLTISKQNKMAVLRKSFVNNMTHELKTPVATVMAAIEAVQRYGARDDKSKMKRYLNISHRELEHLSDMIERVLQLDMDEVNGIRLDRDNFDLVQLILECMETAKLHSNKNVSITFRNTAPAIGYYGDKAHFKNVLNNLMDNAIKYSDQHVEIVIDLSEDKDQLTLQVADRGQGIPPRYINDIFDMFFRVPEGNLHAVKGYGLGLSYVKQIIEKHGGHIQVSSKVGEGSAFTIVLPTTQ